MPTYIDTTNLSPATIAQLQGPVISQIQITNNSYTVLDDTAVSTSGGYIKITGSNFTAGTQVVIGTVAATSVTYVNSTTLNVQVPAQSAGTYVVYVTVNTGSVAILVNGLTYSGTPTWVTGSTLPAGQVNTAISIQLSATGDAPLTYALAAGSSLPPGVTLTSGGLLSGTVTGITSETVYNFTINAIDAEAQDSPRSFSITITANDQYFNYVTALLSASTPTSTFVADASTNAFTVTVNGDTRPSNFGPYTPGYYSNFFDGTGDYLTVADTTALQMTGDFTWEAWVYPLSLPAGGNFKTFWAQRANDAGFGGPAVVIDSAGNLLLFVSNATANAWAVSGFDTGLDVSTNQWQHIALVKNGTTLTLYKNGIAGTSTTHSTAVGTSSSLSLMAGAANGIQAVDGYMSNFRIVKGTAVYTAAFTPSTIPLTAITNTSLLTCQSNRLIDNSTNNFAITRNGDVRVDSFDPFLPDSNFAGRGSGFYDGTGDYLTVADNVALQMGSGDFTIEFWWYPTSITSPAFQTPFDKGYTSTGALLLQTGNGNGIIVVYASGSAVITASTAVTVNAWNHMALVRNSTTLTLYLNGVSVGSATNSTNFNATNAVGIGANSSGGLGAGSYSINGYMSNMRVVKGTAVYTTTFTPPATPLTAVANTQLLTLQNNQPNNNNMFLDSSTNNFNITRNGNTTQGAFTPYAGTWSVNFPNSGVLNSQSTSGAYLSIPNNTGFDMGTGDFTMEGWIYPQSFPSSDNWPSAWFQTSSLFGRGTNNLGDGYNLILGATRLIFQNSDTNVTNGLHNMVVNNWYHVAACRSSGTLRLFVNGVQVASTSFTSSVGGGSNFFIGCETGQGAYFNGYMSNIRVLKGTALYTGAFTPPTQPLIPTSSTSLLTCADNRFIDDSNYRSVVTATNSPTIQKLSPFAPQLQQTPTSYSVAFDGTGDYLSCGTNSAYAMGTGDFTWEAWVYFASGSSFRQIFSTRPSNGSSTTAGSLSVSNTNGLNWYTNSAIINYTTSIGTDQWVHVAICRSGTTIRAFANGVEVGSATNSDNLTASTFSVGANNDGSEAFNGSISNVRVVKGTALYTANFTPSTTPLTAVAGTSLLTCQNTTIIDNSTNNFAITVNGNSQPIPQNPFGYTNPSSTGYTPTIYGGSGYFDGTGDYLTVPYSSAFSTGTTYTIEAFVYPTVLNSLNFIFQVSNTNVANFGGWLLWINASGSIYFECRPSTGGTNVQVIGGTVPRNSWSHIAVSVNANSVKIYLNGAQVASGTVVAIDGTQSNVGIGALTNGAAAAPWTGYISDVRLIKGTALYTSNFVPPVAPLTALQNTVLLNNMTGAGIYDSSMMANYETVGNASISTSIKKYGNTSMYFDGTGDYLSAADSPVFEVGSADFTIEAWIYVVSYVSTSAIVQKGAAGAYSPYLIYIGGSSEISFYSSTNGSNWAISDLRIATNPATNTWHHIAVTRSGTTFRTFFNGALANSTTLSGSLLNNSGPLLVGYYTASFNGYIDDLRITNGVARYTANFTPPTSPFITF